MEVVTREVFWFTLTNRFVIARSEGTWQSAVYSRSCRCPHRARVLTGGLRLVLDACGEGLCSGGTRHNLVLKSEATRQSAVKNAGWMRGDLDRLYPHQSPTPFNSPSQEGVDLLFTRGSPGTRAWLPARKSRVQVRNPAYEKIANTKGNEPPSSVSHPFHGGSQLSLRHASSPSGEAQERTRILLSARKSRVQARNPAYEKMAWHPTRGGFALPSPYIGGGVGLGLVSSRLSRVCMMRRE